MADVWKHGSELISYELWANSTARQYTAYSHRGRCVELGHTVMCATCSSILHSVIQGSVDWWTNCGSGSWRVVCNKLPYISCLPRLRIICDIFTVWCTLGWVERVEYSGTTHTKIQIKKSKGLKRITIKLIKWKRTVLPWLSNMGCGHFWEGEPFLFLFVYATLAQWLTQQTGLQ